MLTNQLTRLGVVPVMSNHLPAGRLRDHINTWKVITKDPWIINTVQGHQIDFLSEPHQEVVPHTPQYSVEQSQLIVEEVQELLGKGAITEVHNPRGGFYSKRIDTDLATETSPVPSLNYGVGQLSQDVRSVMSESPSDVINVSRV